MPKLRQKKMSNIENVHLKSRKRVLGTKDEHLIGKVKELRAAAAGAERTVRQITTILKQNQIKFKSVVKYQNLAS